MLVLVAILALGGCSTKATAPSSTSPGTAVESSTTTPSGPGPYVLDTFDRVVTSSSGSANIGGTWVLRKGVAADLSVDGTGGE